MAQNHFPNTKRGAGQSQARPRFSWPALRGAIAFYEKEGVCYLPAGWGRKNPALDSWEEFETRLPTMAEKADWFHEGKATNIGVVCGGVSGGLVILCFNAPDGAREFFEEERWQKLPEATFITQSVRGYHVWLRSDTPIKSQKVPKDENESWLEIRSDGNFTVAPPSLHPDGVLYQAVGVDRIYKPDDLAGFIVKRLIELRLREALRPKEVTDRRKKHPPCLEIISKCDWPKPKKLEEELLSQGKPERSKEFNELAIEQLLKTCPFIQHCRDDAPTLSEPDWFSECDILSFFGEPGREKAHELSQPYPKYTREETDKKLEYAKKAKDKDVGPHTCAHIEKNLGFSCPEDCLASKLSYSQTA